MFLVEAVHHAPVSRRIIVLVSDEPLSLRAVPPARDLARFMGAETVLVSAVGNEDLARRRSQLRSVARTFLTTDVRIDVRLILSGDPVATVLAAAGIDDVIAMASHADVFSADGFVGSFTESVSSRHPGPVLVIGPACELEGGFDVDQVIVGVEDLGSSQGLLAEAARWARMLDTALCLMNASEAHPGAAFTLVDRVELQRTAHALRSSDLDVDSLVWGEADPLGAFLDMVDHGALPVLAAEPTTGLERIARHSVTSEVCARSKRPVVVKGLGRPPSP
jgi:nucleotide-binding universal stress UspA family protein